jgi:GNAT superfamily N-acetyltransferase
MAMQPDTHAKARLRGPYPITEQDISPLNVMFSEAFTDRYRRDGLVGVRVPPLNPVIWRYAIQNAADGAMLWRDERGGIAAFNLAHHSGHEGWMGPLAVREDCQGAGHGKVIVRAAIDHLKDVGCRVIGLETMPRTMDNIGFYASMGFVPGRLTLTMTLDGAPSLRAPTLLSALESAERERAIAACAALTNRVQSGYDYTRELRLTAALGLGDTILLHEGDRLVGFALSHSTSLVEGRAREEIRVLKVVMQDESLFSDMMPLLADYARRSGAIRAAIRVQSEHTRTFRTLVEVGARVRWTDLRMSLSDYEERAPSSGLLISNWEI